MLDETEAFRTRGEGGKGSGITPGHLFTKTLPGPCCPCPPQASAATEVAEKPEVVLIVVTGMCEKIEFQSLLSGRRPVSTPGCTGDGEPQCPCLDLPTLPLKIQVS